MELGNLAFGNSRGNYPIQRDEGWEDQLYRLFDELGCDAYGTDFENDAFWVMPYYWGDCGCGWDSLDDGQAALRRLQHRDDCYRHEYKEVEARAGVMDHERKMRLLKPIYQRHGWDTNAEDWWHGCARRCTCDYYERYDAILDQYAEEFGHLGHNPDCKLARPNFYYKPLAFGISWYKYPLRDSYMSERMTLEDFRLIINHCIESLGRG